MLNSKYHNTKKISELYDHPYNRLNSCDQAIEFGNAILIFKFTMYIRNQTNLDHVNHHIISRHSI